MMEKRSHPSCFFIGPHAEVQAVVNINTVAFPAGMEVTIYKQDAYSGPPENMRAVGRS